MSDSVRPHRRQPTRFLHPWDSPGKNTGVVCLFLLPCMKVKSESEVAQSCPTLSNPMDCSPPGSSIDGIFQARVLEWGAIAFSKIFVYILLKLNIYIFLKYLIYYILDEEFLHDSIHFLKGSFFPSLYFSLILWYLYHISAIFPYSFPNTSVFKST